MRYASLAVFAAAAGLVLFGLLPIQAQPNSPGEEGPELEFTERREEIRPWFPIVPDPPHPASPLTEDLGYQLVGFSAETFAGNRGILNLNRTCQRRFPLSRVCTAQEVSQTIAVPMPPGYGYAWIQNGGGAGNSAGRDCNGWTSDSKEVRGVTIEMGADTGCYGGFLLRGCDELHPVACCARVSADGHSGQI